MDLNSHRRSALVRRNAPSTLKVTGQMQAVASFAQQRIWLHEQLYFDRQFSSLAIYNILLPLKIKRGSMSVERIRLAILSVLDKHMVLRTAVHFNQKTGQLEQEVQPLSHDLYSFEHTPNLSSSEQFEAMLTAETVTNYFDVGKGKVVRCHLMQINNDGESDNLQSGDLLVFTIHHIAFDNSSLRLFTTAFVQAYRQLETVRTPYKALQYIDFTLYEQAQLQLPMAGKARHFWATLLHDYDWNKTFLLSTDNSINRAKTRSGRGFSTAFALNSNLVQAQMNFAATHNVSMFQLCLACYYVFIFKVGAGEDMCVASTFNNRSLVEMKSMMGMFANTLPYRIKLDPHQSFHQFAVQVQNLCLSMFEHSHLPYQHILGVQGNERQPMPQTFFRYESLMSSTTYTTTVELPVDTDNNTILDVYYDRDRAHGNGVALFDMTLAVSHSHHAQTTECFLECSADLVDNQTFLENMADRFQCMLQQLFVEQNFDLGTEPINHLSLLLPQERNEIELMVFKRVTATNEGPASFAQARIWLDERARFDPNNPKVAIYNMPFLFHIEIGSLSLARLRRALQLVIMKHQSLRTALVFDGDKQQLMQRIVQPTQNQELFAFAETIIEMNDECLMTIMHDERGNPFHFNLAQGLVCRLHIIRRSSKSDCLVTGDSIILNFHHALFDFPSMVIFYHDLDKAYRTGQLEFSDENELRYLDYAIVEQQMPMTMASAFWLEALHDHEIDRPLSLPFDRHRVSDEQRTGRGTSVSIDFGQDLSRAFLAYSSVNNTTPEHLSLACYFAFLFKLTNGERDLCVAMNTTGRFKDELHSIIGMFVNTIPLRLPHFDPSISFSQFVEQVRLMATRSMELSYFPLQRILGQHSKTGGSPAFLDTSFDYESTEKSIDQGHLSLGEVLLTSAPYSLQSEDDKIMNQFDFSLRIQHDKATDQLSCEIDASLDIFNQTTVHAISQRFHGMLQQLFINTTFNKACQTICELSIHLPDEVQLIESINNKTGQMDFPQLDHLHHEFVRQAYIHPQKISICLDEQSLTYAELLTKVYQLVHRLGKRQRPNEVICQCVERSIEMIIGQLAIIASGAVYCGLSPDDPPARLAALVTQTKAQLVFVHPATANLFVGDQRVLDLHSCLLDDMHTIIHDTDENICDATVSGDTII